MERNYIYIIHLREFIATGENTYKIGRTSKPRSRLNGYPKGSRFVAYSEVSDMIEMEKKLITIFKNKFTHMKNEYGNEYFNGSIKEMKKIFFGLIVNDIDNIDDNGYNIKKIKNDDDEPITQLHPFIKYLNGNIIRTESTEDYISALQLFSYFKSSPIYTEMPNKKKKKCSKEDCVKALMRSQYRKHYHCTENKNDKSLPQIKHPKCKNSNILGGYKFIDIFVSEIVAEQ